MFFLRLKLGWTYFFHESCPRSLYSGTQFLKKQGLVKVGTQAKSLLFPLHKYHLIIIRRLGFTCFLLLLTQITVRQCFVILNLEKDENDCSLFDIFDCTSISKLFKRSDNLVYVFMFCKLFLFSYF